MLESCLWDLFCGGSYLSIQPLVRLPGLLLSVVISLLICRLSLSGSKALFPRQGFMLVCFLPLLLYFLLGCLLSLIDLGAVENTLISMGLPGMYKGKLFLLYNGMLYTVIRDVSIGWSIFCMMKYNQSMRIKALLDMQPGQSL